VYLRCGAASFFGLLVMIEDDPTVSQIWRARDGTSRYILAVVEGIHTGSPPLAEDDWTRVAYRHGLIGVLAREGAEPVRAAVRPVYARILANQQVIDSHAPRLLAALEDAGIRAAVLKGPYLDRHVFRSRGIRTYSDLDVLVAPHQVEQALEVLAADEAVGVVPARRPRAPKRDLPVRDGTGASFSLDLHWDLFGYSQLLGCAEGATERALEAASPTDGPLGPAWNLPIETSLAFLCAHALLDHRFRLILFRDLAELARHDIDWDAVGRFVQRFGLRSTTYLALWIARSLARAEIDSAILADLRPRNFPTAVAQQLLPRTDVVRFDGHRPHLLNLAIVLMHDEAAKRVRLLLRSPAAFPMWWRRTADQARPDMTAQPPQRAASAMIVVTTNRRRGAEVQGERLASGLRERGWAVSLAALTSASTQLTVEADRLTDRSPDELGPLNLDVLRGLRRHITRMDPGVVIASGSATLRYSIAALGFRNSGPKLIYVSIGEPSYWIRNSKHRWQQRILLSRVDKVIAVSDATRAQLIEHLGVPADRVMVAHSGVPTSLLTIEAAPPTGDTRLLFLGSLSAEKGPDVALQALAALAGSPSCRLRFVGAGPLQDDLQMRIADLNLTDLVEFAGSADDITPHLAWADILLLTSRTEGLPGAAIEAAAAGIPTVGFDVGGTREVVRDGETGRLVPPGDFDALVGALKALAADSHLRALYGQAGRQLVKDGFLLEHAVERYDRLLRDILATP